MDDSEFIASLDCSFPYSTPLRWRRAIADAIKISPNAAFMVAHELCRPPRSAGVTIAQRLEIWRHLSKRLHHPLTRLLSGLIVSRIKGIEVPVTMAVEAMMLVRLYPKQYNALSICYFSCDCVRKADALHERITCEWQNA